MAREDERSVVCLRPTPAALFDRHDTDPRSLESCWTRRGKMAAYPVSMMVDSPRNDVPDCANPLAGRDGPDRC